MAKRKESPQEEQELQLGLYDIDKALTIADELVQSIENYDTTEKTKGVQKELVRILRYIDENIKEIDMVIRKQKKFKYTLVKAKTELIRERTKILETLAKIIKEEREEELEEKNIESIDELLKG